VIRICENGHERIQLDGPRCQVCEQRRNARRPSRHDRGYGADHARARDALLAMLPTPCAYGWRAAHFRPARTAKGWRTPVAADGAGFPDLVLVRRTRIVAAELKSGRVTRTACGIPATDERLSWPTRDRCPRCMAALGLPV
jgi:hypothetical protein